MKLVFAAKAWVDYQHWVVSNPRMQSRIAELIDDCRRNSATNLGKPERLQSCFGGWWSRRISGEHRLVYRVTGCGEVQALEIAQCRYHY